MTSRALGKQSQKLLLDNYLVLTNGKPRITDQLEKVDVTMIKVESKSPIFGKINMEVGCCPETVDDDDRQSYPASGDQKLALQDGLEEQPTRSPEVHRLQSSLEPLNNGSCLLSLCSTLSQVQALYQCLPG